MNTKLKYDGFDIIKLVMAIFVVCIHTGFAEVISSEKWLRPLFDTAVPFFFMTSAFLLFEKIENSNIGPRNVFNRYLLHFVKLYCIWSFIYFPFAVYYYVTTKTNIAVAVFDYFRGFFLIGQHYYSFQLWYLLSTILGVAVLKILYKRISEKMLLCTAVAVYVISETLTYLADNLELFTGVAYKLGRLIQLTIGDGLVLSGFFWLALGSVLHSYKKSLNALSLTGGGYCLISSVLCYVLFVITNSKVLFVLTCVFVFLFAISIKNMKHLSGFIFRKISTAIYFVHMIYFFFWSVIVGYENRMSLAGVLFTLSGSIFTAVIYLQIVYKVRSYEL